MRRQHLSSGPLAHLIVRLNDEVAGTIREVQLARWTSRTPEAFDDRPNALGNAGAYLHEAVIACGDHIDRRFGTGTGRRSVYLTGVYLITLTAALLILGRGATALLIANVVATPVFYIGQPVLQRIRRRRELRRLHHPARTEADHLTVLDILIAAVDPEHDRRALARLRDARYWLSLH
ncbi:hypothetical protein [Dactylosporangium sp. CA-233914]|uniref:hypothetical protein n=1 Tax=Dactylosporangium sp. CA-233914 TaxID=3239934 RepID=UPI003D8CC940